MNRGRSVVGWQSVCRRGDHIRWRVAARHIDDGFDGRRGIRHEFRAAVDGETVTDFNGTLTTVLSYWHWCRRRRCSIRSTLSDSFLPSETILRTKTYGGTGSGEIDRNNSGAIAFRSRCRPGPTRKACCSNSESGRRRNRPRVYIGFDGGNDLVIRIGDGSASYDPAGTARMVIPSASFLATKRIT